MSGTLILSDGREFGGSNLALDAMFTLIAQELQADHPKFSRWLNDVANRPGGMMNWDMRALSKDDVAAFYTSAEKAYRKLLPKFGVRIGENEFGKGALARLMKTLGVQVEVDDSLTIGPPDYAEPFNKPLIDFNDIWGCGNDAKG